MVTVLQPVSRRVRTVVNRAFVVLAFPSSAVPSRAPQARLLLGGLASAALVITLSACVSGTPQQLAVGDCLVISSVGDEFSEVPVVDCETAHEAEVYSVHTIGGSWGDDYDAQAVVATVEDECIARFEAYVGEPYATSSIDVFYVYPLADGWAEGDREVVCAAFAPDPDTGDPVAFRGTLAAST